MKPRSLGGPLLILWLTSSGMKVSVATPEECFSRFHASLTELNPRLDKKFGAGWTIAGVDRVTASELEAIHSEHEKVNTHFKRLQALREFAQDQRTRVVRQQTEAIAQRRLRVQQRSDQLERDAEYWLGQMKLQIAAEDEYARKPGIVRIDDENFECTLGAVACAPLEQELDRLNEGRRRIKDAQQRGIDEANAIAEEKQRINNAEEEFKAARVQAERSAEMFADSFMNICGDANARVVAFAAVLDAGGPIDRKPSVNDEFEKLMRPLWQEPLVQLFKLGAGMVPAATAAGRIAPPTAAVATIVSTAFTVGNFVPDAIDDRTAAIVNRTYLVGDYAYALARLKERGRLSPGEHGYDAIIRMNQRLGQEFRQAGGDFTWDAIGRASPVNAFATALAGNYVTGKIEAKLATQSPGSNLGLKGLTTAGAGQRLFHKHARTYAGGTATGVLVQQLEQAGTRLRRAREREAAELGIKQHASAAEN